jgi:tetratricopeptide (TPR) repeat protein
MPRKPPTPTGLALVTLRSALGMNQKEAAEAAGERNRQFSRWEVGRGPSPSRYAEIAARWEAGPEAVEEALLQAESLLATLEGQPGETPVDPTAAERRAIAADSARAARVTFRESCDRLLARSRRLRIEEHRAWAAKSWSEFAEMAATRRRLILERREALWLWALCERLCKESVTAAPDDAEKALALAQLALQVAEAAPGSEAWRLHLQGYAWAFVGNARRVSDDLDAADEAFERSRSLLAAPELQEVTPLDLSRVLDLEASLRRDQRRFQEAFDLLDRAMEACPTAAGRGRLLLIKAYTQEQAGDPEASLSTLEEAAHLIDADAEPRLKCVLLYNVTSGLARLGRYREAEARIPEVRELVLESRNGLDLLRLVWLEGYVAGGLGHLEEGVATLEQVRGVFTARANAYDAALVTLDLCELLLRQGRAGEVKRRSEEMAWVFESRKIHREALAAFALFCRAAEQEQATLELVRRVAAFLRRARHDQRLRFEP